MTVLFDLDGTLLPMDTEAFARSYFGLLSGALAPYGYEPKALVEGIWRGIAAMVKNDGSRTNEQVFWQTFTSIFGQSSRDDEPRFDEFYRTAFNGARAACGYTHMANAVVSALKARGDGLILASNPVFPRIAHERRCGWAGVDAALFDYITSYENSHYCKPNPKYYSEILEVNGLRAADCVMVGNDAEEDLCAAQAGIKVFILTPCLINTKNTDISSVPHGGYKELVAFLGLSPLG